MNARTIEFQFKTELQKLDELLACIFHTVLIHRTLGRYTYNSEYQFSVESVGFTDVDCEFINFSYTRTTSDALNRNVNRNISEFCDVLRSNEHISNTGQISLEFYQKRKPRWSFQTSIPWEVWTVHVELIKIDDETERHDNCEMLSELLSEKIAYITEVMNKEEFVPKTPSSSELPYVFDTSFSSVQPYLFKFDYSIAGSGVSINSGSTSVSSTLNKLIQSFKI